jgi:S1-C subfamily serine protease
MSRRLAVLAVSAVLAGGGCGSASSDPRIDSALRIEATGCTATVRTTMGTALDDRFVVTTAHGIAGAASVTVLNADGDEAEATVVLFDPLLDVAGLRTDAPVATPARVRDGRARADESGVVAVADDDGLVTMLDVEVVRRATILTTDIYRDDDVERPGFEIAAVIERGDSGTAVHLDGGVVGIVWARSTIDDRRAWAVDLPDVVADPARRSTLVDPVDTGICP